MWKFKIEYANIKCDVTIDGDFKMLVFVPADAMPKLDDLHRTQLMRVARDHAAKKGYVVASAEFIYGPAPHTPDLGDVNAVPLVSELNPAGPPPLPEADPDNPNKEMEYNPETGEAFEVDPADDDSLGELGLQGQDESEVE